MFHRGTLPDSKNNIYVYDIRLLCFSTPAGFRPLGMYSRRAHAPLSASLASGESSWEQVGTNLSCATATGWKSETERVLYMDRKNFPQLGLGIDDLIEGSAMLFVCVLFAISCLSILYKAFSRANNFPPVCIISFAVCLSSVRCLFSHTWRLRANQSVHHCNRQNGASTQQSWWHFRLRHVCCYEWRRCAHERAHGLKVLLELLYRSLLKLLFLALLKLLFLALLKLLFLDMDLAFDYYFAYYLAFLIIYIIMHAIVILLIFCIQLFWLYFVPELQMKSGFIYKGEYLIFLFSSESCLFNHFILRQANFYNLSLFKWKKMALFFRFLSLIRPLSMCFSHFLLHRKYLSHICFWLRGIYVFSHTYLADFILRQLFLDVTVDCHDMYLVDLLHMFFSARILCVCISFFFWNIIFMVPCIFIMIVLLLFLIIMWFAICSTYHSSLVLLDLNFNLYFYYLSYFKCQYLQIPIWARAIFIYIFIYDLSYLNCQYLFFYHLRKHEKNISLSNYQLHHSFCKLQQGLYREL